MRYIIHTNQNYAYDLDGKDLVLYKTSYSDGQDSEGYTWSYTDCFEEREVKSLGVGNTLALATPNFTECHITKIEKIK